MADDIKISEERLRNTRAWAAARVGQLSGADVIVGAIDELLKLRAPTTAQLTVSGRPLEEEAIMALVGRVYLAVTTGPRSLDVSPNDVGNIVGLFLEGLAGSDPPNPRLDEVLRTIATACYSVRDET